MDNKLSELSKPVGFVSKQAQALLKSGDTASVRPFFDVQGSSPLYSQEYVSALLEDNERVARDLVARNGEIEGLRKIAAELEAKNAQLKKELHNEGAANANAYERIRELEKRLATPVQLQNCDFESVAIMAHWCTDEQLKAWVKGVEHAKKQIRAAGFKVKGDE